MKAKTATTITYEYERYITTKENLRATLDRFGVALIPRVLNEQETNQMKNGMWNYLEHITRELDRPIQRNDRNSWVELIDKLFPQNTMLMQFWEMGHAQFLWELRQNERILDIWSHLWGVSKEDLLVSFDGASFSLPPEATKRGWYRGHKWLHTDQSYARNDFECIQSWVTAYDVNDGDATLTFLEGSHQYHGEFRQRFLQNLNKEDEANVRNKDWFMIKDEDHVAFYKDEKKCPQKCIKCPAGSMVFWDSRTIHSGRQPLKGRRQENFRCVAYLCYTKRSQATPVNMKKKQKAFDEMRTTSHWPHKIKVFAKKPRHYGKGYPKITKVGKPVVTKLGRRLAEF